ncbi:MAG TPA: histidinol-phosphatase HisJ family protein [Lachnospiraceae bacterium]
MLGDFHTHTRFSLDSDSAVEDMIEAAIAKKMAYLCITDHIDWDYPAGEDFDFSLEEYFEKLKECKKIYKEKIKLFIGVELGLQPQLKAAYAKLLKDYPFDFVIGSTHLVNGKDPYYKETFEGHSDREIFQSYFESTLKNVQTFSEYDSLGHLDYVVRYGQKGAEDYNYESYKEVIDEILSCIVKENKALEVNMAGLRKKLGFPNPHYKVIKRFHDLGGKMITIGSDAHRPGQMAFGFLKLKNILKEAGFDSYVRFEQRNPIFEKL